MALLLIYYFLFMTASLVAGLLVYKCLDFFLDFVKDIANI